MQPLSSPSSPPASLGADDAVPVDDHAEKRLPLWLRFVRYLFFQWWRVLVILIIGNYVPGGVITGLQSGWPAFVNYFTSFGLLAPLRRTQPTIFWTLLSALVGLALVGFWAHQHYRAEERTHAVAAAAALKKSVEQARQDAASAHQLAQALTPSAVFDPIPARSTYLAELSNRYDVVTLPFGSRERQLALEAIFQPLKLRRDPFAAEDLAKQERRSLLDEPMRAPDDPRLLLEEVSVISQVSQAGGKTPSAAEAQSVTALNGADALEQSRDKRMVVLGGPGTGKTTALKELLHTATVRAQDDPGAPLPLFIALPTFARIEEDFPEKSLQPYLSSYIQGLGIDTPYANVLWSALITGNVFICLDGLDEVAPAQRQALIDMINRDARTYGGVWIVGSRFTDYKGGQFQRGLFTEWELQPLTHALRLLLAQRLLPALAAAFGGEQGLSATEQAAEIFVHEVESHQEAATWGANPLLFSLAAMPYVQTGTLPASRAGLYHEVIEAVLATHEMDPEWRTILRRTLADLALWLYTAKKGRTFTGEDLIAFLIDGQQHAPSDAVEIGRKLKGTGVMEIVAHETWGFRHQTFQEYLAAVSLARRFTASDATVREQAWALAWSKRTYSRWAEILSLLVGVLIHDHGASGLHVAQKWVVALAQQQATAEGDIGDLGLELALRSLGEGGEVSTEWKDEQNKNFASDLVDGWAQKLLSAIRSRSQRQIDRLGTFGGLLARLSVAVVGPARDLLVTALQDESDWVRLNVVWTLGGLGNHAPMEVISDALRDPVGRVRLWAARALGRLGERAPIEPLVHAAYNDIDDALGEARATAVETLALLVSFGRPVSDEIFTALFEDTNTPFSVRAATVRALGAQIPSAMLKRAAADENWQVRKTAIDVMKKLGGHVPVKLLTNALVDQQAEVRESARQVISDFIERGILAEVVRLNFAEEEEQSGDELNQTGQLMSLLLSWIPIWQITPTEILEQDPRWQPIKETCLQLYVEEGIEELARDLLSRFGERPATEALTSDELDDLQTEINEADDGTRMIITDLLIEWAFLDIEVEQFGAVALLTAALHADDPLLRKGAILAINLLGEDKAIPALVEMLKDTHPAVRADAVTQFLKWRDRASIEPLMHVAIHDKDWQVRLSAIHTLHVLQNLGSHVLVETIVLALNDNNERVRGEAVHALSMLGERTPISAWVKALHDTSANVRQQAAQLLGQSADQAFLASLERAVSDAETELRRRSLEILGRAGDLTPIEPLLNALHDQDDQVRLKALEQLGQRTPLDLLTEILLHDPTTTLRLAAAKIICQLGNPVGGAALGALLEQILLEDHTSRDLDYVYPLVVNAFVPFGNHAPLESLVQLLLSFEAPQGVQLQSVVYRMLGQQTEWPPHPRLIKALTDPETPLYLRQWIAEAIRQQGRHISFDSLLKTGREGDPATRSASFLALTSHEDQAERIPRAILLEAKQETGRLGREAVVTLLGWRPSDPMLGIILAALNDIAMQVRSAAARALSNLGACAATPVVIDALVQAILATAEDLQAAAEGFRAPLREVPETVTALSRSDDVVGIQEPKHTERDTPDRTNGVARRRYSVPEPFTGYGQYAMRQDWRGSFLVRQNIPQYTADTTTLKAMLEALETLCALRLFVPSNSLIAALLTALGNEYHETRTAAATALGLVGSQTRRVEVVEALMAALEDSDFQVRFAVISALKRLGTALPEKALSSRYLDVRVEALRTQVQYGGEISFEQMLPLFNSSLSNPFDHWWEIVQPVVILALTRLDAVGAIAVLTTALKAEGKLDFQKRSRLRQVFKHLADVFPFDVLTETFFQGFITSDVDQRRLLVEVLGDLLGRAPTPFLLTTLSSALGDPSPQVRIAAVQTLGAAGVAVSLAELRGMLADSDLWVRVATVKAMGDLAPLVPIASELVIALRDPEDQVRRAAVDAFAKVGNMVSIDVIDALATLVEHAQGDAQGSALSVLSRYWASAPERIEHLLRAVLDSAESDSNLRYVAAGGLGQMESAPRSPLTENALLRALGDDSSSVRQAAMTALGHLHMEQATTRLREALGDSAPEVFKSALEALGAIQPQAVLDVVPEASEILSGNGAGHILGSTIKRFMAQTLGDMGQDSPPILNILTHLLDWPYWEVRAESASALGKLRRNIPDNALRRLLELRHDPESRAVSRAADDALAAILTLETGIEDD